jgi:hypothetical protein
LDPVPATFPAVSPDGSWVVYSRGETPEAELYLVPITGGDPIRLTRNMKHAIQPDWGSLATGEPAAATHPAAGPAETVGGSP